MGSTVSTAVVVPRVSSTHAAKVVSVVPAPQTPTCAAGPAAAVAPAPTQSSRSRASSTDHHRSSSTTVLSLTTSVLFGVYTPTKWDIYMLGITIVIGGQYFSWNAGLAAGLGSYLIAYALVAGAYIALVCCTSEVTGALPFAGGAYGLSRCTLGFFPGYLIGCCEALEYIAYVATSVMSLTKMLVDAAPALRGLEPVIALVFYVSALAVHIRGSKVFWVFTVIVSATSFAVALLFVVGSLPYADFAANALHGQQPFVSGVTGFLKVLPLATWFFVGIEALSLASDQVAEPKTAIPFAQVACVLTLLASSLAILLVAVSLPPGVAALAHELVPFNSCFTQLLTIEHRHATILSIPATYATAFGFMWCYGKLIASMANSRLLPSILATTSRRFGTVYVSLCAGSLLSYAIFLLVHFFPVAEQYIFSVCITAAFMSYIGQCVGYIALKRRYKNIKSSSFKSPFGIFGALYSMAVWSLGIIAIAGFQGNDGVEIGAFAIGVLLLTVYYYAYARKRQTFSPQENKVLLVAHVMKFNAMRQKRSPVRKIQVHHSISSTTPHL